MEKIDLKIKKISRRGNEAYKALRTNIGFCGEDIKVIAYTSSIPGEGKSMVSFQTAYSLADIGKKVVYVDADLRKSTFIQRYDVQAEIRGLTHLLAGKAQKEDVIYPSNKEGLDVIIAGPVPPNPAELLANDYFTELVRYLREHYDYAIIDTPPLGNVIDTAIISKNCDGMILVVAQNTVSYRLVQDVVAQMENTGCRILGAVLNKADMNDNQYYGK
ncbi:MAG: polysaccharide biosynthesis tyrosine autokinase, partial [Lachnospiraceae bacterium]|nr:polysaccharide biosynthesis tyrosine autokinase [Lachnospiraceae bacterium]